MASTRGAEYKGQPQVQGPALSAEEPATCIFRWKERFVKARHEIMTKASAACTPGFEVLTGLSTHPNINEALRIPRLTPCELDSREIVGVRSLRTWSRSSLWSWS